MSCAAGPDINENGLVLALDAANTKSILSAVEVLVVAGGGGGGMDMGGGGGGGGVIYSSAVSITPGSAITATVGNGGVGAPAAGTNGQPGGHQYTIPATQGGNSVFGALTAIGGGFGGSSYRGYTPGIAGGSGGSGGGSSGYNDNAGTFLGGLGTSGQGNRGGNSTAAYYSGGGGGAGAQGVDSTGQPNGGVGVENSILGVSYFWGGGGGGASYSLSTGGNGGNGGGGGGALGTTVGGSGLNPGSPGGGGGPNQWANTPGGNAGANTGGGGGGGSHYNANNKGGDGGSGIVIVRYPGSQRATGGTVTSVGGYTIHTFTTSGTFTPNFGDLTGRGNTGTLTNGPTYSSANGGSLSFDGTNDFVTTANTTISGSQTFSVWAMVTGGPNAPAGILTQHNYASTANFGINHVDANKLAPSIGYTNGTREYNDKVTNFIITNDVIFNAVLVYNSSENKIYWYINGQLDSSYTLSATPKSTNYPICLGRWDGGYGAYYFNGRVYSGNIHNRALTAQEVQQNYNATRGRYGI